ncbi:MAG: exodeoxyribonuclease III, partial [Gammaproteobacteria bacterium]
MKVASWNVNSINVRLPHVLDWLDIHRPDILGLQELKLPTEKFPVDALTEVGYHSIVNGQKTYNGVALLSRSLGDAIVTDIPDYSDEQRRVVAASFGDTRILNLYVPNGQTVGSEKYEYKLGWLDALQQWIVAELGNHERVLVMGDFNIAPEDQDVHDPEEWRDKVLCSKPERERLQALLSLGMKDSFRLFDQPEDSFSWWDYRAAGFRRNRGLRIDLLLVSDALAETCTAGGIDKEPRMLERPSDHAPVWV